MVRTKADLAGFKAVGAKAARKSGPPPPSPQSNNSVNKGNTIGGNTYQPRETPAWQKPITSFFAGNFKVASNEAPQQEPEKAA